MSEIKLRDGTIVRHFTNRSLGIPETARDLWEVEYPDGEKCTFKHVEPPDWRESARILEERWGGDASD